MGLLWMSSLAMRSHKVQLIAGMVSVSLACVLMLGCKQASKPATPAPAIVTVSTPIEREVTDFADFSGRTAAVESVEVRARVGGYLDKVNFREGELVHKGDVLFEIDPRPYQAQVDFAQGQVQAKEAILRRAQADNARARNLAATTTGAISQQELDQYKATEDQAFADLDTARATLKTGLLNLEFTKVTSPIDGRASRFNVTVGNLVIQDQTLLTTLVSVDPIYAYFDVDESTVLHMRELIRSGQVQSARKVEVPVWLSLANEGGFVHQGRINFVDNQVNQRTGTLSVRGVFPNKDEALSPGLFVRIRVRIGVPHPALLVVDRAIETDQGQRVLYLVNEKNEVVYRPVRVGARYGSLRAILEGLKPDERLIVNGLQRVRPGVVVEPKLVEMPTLGEVDLGSGATTTTSTAAAAPATTETGAPPAETSEQK